MSTFKLIAATLLVAATFPVAASPVLLDFQDTPLELLNGSSNFNYGGLRFSPSCRIHHGHDNQGKIWLQSDHDNSNCDVYDPVTNEYLDGLPNSNFLGFNREDFYVDREGKTFSLLALAGVGYNGTMFTVQSSKGGSFTGEVPWREDGLLPYESFSLTGSEWTDITWFTLSNFTGYGGWQPHQGWDDISYNYRPNPVPEPGTLGSLLVGVAGLYVFRRHRQWQRKQPNRPTMM